MPRKPGTSANGFTKKCQPNSHIGRLQIAHLVSEAANSPLPDSVQRFNDFNCEFSFFFSPEIQSCIQQYNSHSSMLSADVPINEIEATLLLDIFEYN